VSEVPKVAILERLLMVMNENYWLYGAPTAEAPNRVERWDLRSMIDYSCLTFEMGHFRFTYPTFYLSRNTICQLLLEMQEFENWGEWRMWETEKERTMADIERVVKRTLEAERAREGVKK
jgi:hypothetical protein